MSAAWSQDAPADIIGVLETLFAGADVVPAVFDGRATPGAVAPFVNVWQLAPARVGVGLAAEDWGVHHQQWQVSCHGVTQGQARYMVEQVTSWVWPVGWELVEVGPFVNDTTDKPETWFVPVTFVFRGV